MPDGFAVIAEDESVILRHGSEVIGSTGMAELVESSENLDHLPGNLETAARAILANVQDWVASRSAQPWPGERSQPNPDARMTGQQLRLWYGDQNDPVLELPPVELTGTLT